MWDFFYSKARNGDFKAKWGQDLGGKCVCVCLPIRNYEDHYVFTHQRCEDHRSCEDRYLVPVNIIVLIGLNRQITLRRTTFAVVLITQV